MMYPRNYGMTTSNSHSQPTRRSKRLNQAETPPLETPLLETPLVEGYSGWVKGKEIQKEAVSAFVFPAELIDLNGEKKMIVDFALPAQSFPQVTVNKTLLTSPNEEELAKPWTVLFPDFSLPNEAIKLMKGELRHPTSVLQFQKFIFVAHLNRLSHDDVRIHVSNCFKIPE